MARRCFDASDSDFLTRFPYDFITIPDIDAMGRIVDGWDKQNKRYTEPWDIEPEKINGNIIIIDDDTTTEDDELGLDSNTILDSFDEDDDEFGLEERQSPISQKRPQEPPGTFVSDDALCEYNEVTEKWTTSSSIDECPVEPNISFTDAMKSRAYWLVGLLALQSCSGFILSRNEALLQDHPVIVYFLTMLVGAGGNAGNQASVRGEFLVCIKTARMWFAFSASVDCHFDCLFQQITTNLVHSKTLQSSEV